ncbi:MAG: hypothetical protein KDA79_10000 [Planctomycetaceae bacterium]|nr:hypothetical protein [Planctomycetaceae bacterium]
MSSVDASAGGAAADSSGSDRPMSHRLIQLVERLGDLANPILVKEVRQSLKSRQFVATFLLLLAAAWVVTMFGLVTQADSLEFGSAGSGFFSAFYVVLAVATILIVPFTTFRSLQSERDADTYELLSITTLSPRQIVWGKLLSALVQLFVFYSAITPFIAFTSMLQGFDAPSAAFVLIASMLLSLLLSMQALMFSTLARTKVSQGFMTLVVLAGLAWSLIGTLSTGIGAISTGAITVTSRDFWIGTGIVFVTAASYFFLFLQITTAQLMFESGNRSTGIRVAVAVQFWLFWAAIVLLLPYMTGSGSGPGSEGLMLAIIPPIIHWSVAGLFFVTEPDSLSRRLRRRLPRRFPLRLAAAPLMPGGARGFLFVLLHMAAHWCLCLGLIALYRTSLGSYSVSGFTMEGFLAAVATFNPQAWNAPLRMLTAMCLYIVIYQGIGTALGRWLRTVAADIRPAHVRVLTFLILMAAVIGPFLPRTVGLLEWRDYSILDIGNPMATLPRLESRSRSLHVEILVCLAILGTLSLLINLPAMVRGVRQILRPLGTGNPGPEPAPAVTASAAATPDVEISPPLPPMAAEEPPAG